MEQQPWLAAWWFSFWYWNWGVPMKKSPCVYNGPFDPLCMNVWMGGRVLGWKKKQMIYKHCSQDYIPLGWDQAIGERGHSRHSPTKDRLCKKRYIYIINCTILLARSDDCKTPICDFKEKSGRSLNENPDALLQPAEEGALMASYSVFVLEPGEQVGQYIFYMFHIVE